MSNSKNTTFVNGTPHQINLIDAEGNTHTFPASHNPVRLVQLQPQVEAWQGVIGGFKARVPATKEGEVLSKKWENLPEKQENVFHIVSLPCFQEAARQGIDWLVGFDPDLTVRDAKGFAAAQGGLLFVKKP